MDEFNNALNSSELNLTYETGLSVENSLQICHLLKLVGKQPRTQALSSSEARSGKSLGTRLVGKKNIN